MSVANLAILFTDIEGSSRLWEHERSRMAAALVRHDRLIRTAIEHRGGHVVKTLGDGVLAVFDDAVSAVAAGVDIQRALVASPPQGELQLKVRCGIHYGAVELRDADCFGPTVNRAARVMSVAHGEQILVSQAIADAVGGSLPDDIRLLDLGSVRLKDMTAAERVWQVLNPALRTSFPALRSLESVPNNLPQQHTPFIGRDDDLARVMKLVATGPLVSIVGIGGLGKTRLALQVAANTLDSYPDGAWFVDLASVPEPSLVEGEILRTLGLEFEAGRSPSEILRRHLEPRKLLLVLDNCEHVLSACARIVASIVGTKGDYRLLCTTREPLQLAAEQCYFLAPMSTSATPSDRSDAVDLFIEHARRARPHYTPDPSEVDAISSLCQHLEGIPLALELAASRMRSMSPAEIAARLDKPLQLLRSGRADLPERHKTLTAMIDWSYGMLTDAERALFERFSVFAGGADIDAVEQVCAGAPLAHEDVLDVLDSLVGKSLVTVSAIEVGTRYRMLETIKAYAADKLSANPDAGAWRARHANRFFDIARRANLGLQGVDQAAWAARVQIDHDNIRTAITNALRTDPITAAKIIVAMWRFWDLYGYGVEGRQYIERVLSLETVRNDPTAYGHTLYMAAGLAASQGENVRAVDLIERCLAIRRQGGAKDVDIAATLSTMGFIRFKAGDIAAGRADAGESLTLFRRISDRTGEALELLHLAEIALFEGDFKCAAAHVVDCRRIANEIGHSEIQIECEVLVGNIALDAQRFDEARERFLWALDRSHETGDKRHECIAELALGKLASRCGELEAARMRLFSALTAANAYSMREEMIDCVEELALLAHLEGDASMAVRVVATIHAARERYALAVSVAKRARTQSWLASMRQSLGSAAFEKAWEEGRLEPLNKVVADILTRAWFHPASVANES